MILKGDWYKTGFEKEASCCNMKRKKRVLQYSHLVALSRLPDKQKTIR